MTTIDQKHQILESLDALDQAQTEKVIDYIKALLYTPRDDARYQKLKREGMKEIRKALGKGRKLNPAF
jgi:mRNA-degrading endonuclease RelE of RelBE toxin-antitoxin system